MINRRIDSRRRGGTGIHRLGCLGAGLEEQNIRNWCSPWCRPRTPRASTERWTPFVAYLSKELGIKVTLRIANDYAAVIEGQRAGNIHIAMYGPASYARAYMTGAKVEPFAIEVNGDGTKGYYSVLYVKSDRATRTSRT